MVISSIENTSKSYRENNMAQIYSSSDTSSLSTPHESELDAQLTETEIDTGISTATSSSNASSSDDDEDDYQHVNSINNLVSLFNSTSLNPLSTSMIQQSQIHSSDEDTEEEKSHNQSTEKPKLKKSKEEKTYTIDELASLISKTDLFNDIIHKSINKTIPTKTKQYSQNHEIMRKINNVIDANLSRIEDDPKNFGFKFLSICITCALGGRKGYHRYDFQSTLKFSSIESLMISCRNHRGELNVSNLCYIGHIILYYWGNNSIRDALCLKYGPLTTVVKNQRNIKDEIGANHLWDDDNIGWNQTWIKRKILKEYQERFECDELEFSKILEKLGIVV